MLLRALVLALPGLALALPAAADGTVLRAKGCGDRVFVASGDSYSVLETSDQGVAADGDKLVGEVDKIGYVSLFIPQSGRRFSATVTERGLDRTAIGQRILESCRAGATGRVTSGYVERAAGCGNKIFVNTAEGYAVLERLAGGLVYAGDTLTGDFSRAGRATLKDSQTGGELVVFIDDFQLPKSAAQRKIAASCR
ncbi:MAG TPA: hypothetical protein VMB84_20965 [Stellaceae bacterium]|nr:hypothetical protein [Stellaceae bacterium]